MDLQVQEKTTDFFHKFFQYQFIIAKGFILQVGCHRPGELWTLNCSQKHQNQKNLTYYQVSCKKQRKLGRSGLSRLPSRWSADDPAAWRRDSTKEPGRAILIHEICLHSCSFSKSTCSMEAIFTLKISSQLECCFHAAMQNHMDDCCPALYTSFSSISYVLFPIRWVKITIEYTRVLFSVYSSWILSCLTLHCLCLQTS